LINSFPRSVRLLKAAEYSAVFKKPVRSSDSSFVVLACKNNKEFGRLGLAVAKKRAKRAVDRNRLKRIVRESFRQQESLLAGFDFVVMVKHNSKDQDNSTLQQSIAKHWQNITKA